MRAARFPASRRTAILALAVLVAIPLLPAASAAAAPPAPGGIAGPGAATGALGPASPVRPGLLGDTPATEPWVYAPAGSVGESAVPAPPARAESPAALAAPALPAPSTSTSVAGPLGSVTGQVVDLTTGKPISGASVAVAPASGSCSQSVCATVKTGAAGFFNATASAGLDSVSASATQYLTNTSVEELSTGAKLNMGVIYLAHFGQVNGSVVGDDAAQEAVAGVNISWSLRLTPSVLGYGKATDSSGNFSVWVPPTPVKLRFAPASGYEGNWTYVDVAPYGVLHLAPVRLVVGVTVLATLRDTMTGQPINGTLYGAISFCSRLNGFCFPEGPSANLAATGGTVSALAPPGPVTATALAQGYVQNQTGTPDVPRLPRGSVVDGGTIYLVPGGLAELSSNLSWGNPSKYSSWPGGSVLATACSLDGEVMGATSTVNGKTNVTASTCLSKTLPLGTAQQFTVPPLRNSLTVHASWSIPTGFPAFDNTTWFNATPDRLIQLHSVDLLPGSYIQANVTFLGGGSTSGFTAVACSVDEPSVCGAPVGPYWTYAGYNCAIGSFTFNVFCAPAPPGPDEVTVSAQGYVSGTTWATVRTDCCFKTQLPVHAPDVALLATPTGSGGPLTPISGRVLIATGGGPAVPVGGASVSVCSVQDASTPCARSTSDGGGNFTVFGPIGWDSVSVQANGFVANTVWLQASAAGNSSVAVHLQALTTVTGFVQDAQGHPVGGATVVACPVGAVLACSPIGSGTTQLSGEYAGTIAPGAFPWATYVITASAPGLVSDSRWMNVTPSGLVHLPTLVLEPPSAGPGSQAAAGPSWVDGRVVQAGSLDGLPQASVTACPVLGQFACLSFPDGTSTGGEFNDSLAAGLYRLTISAPGFTTKTVTIAPAGAVPWHVGVVALAPYLHVLGRVAIDPWRSMTLDRGDLNQPPGSQSTFGLGPGSVIVTACGAGQGCGPTAPLGAGGTFNVSAPTNGTITITAVATASAFGTAPGGFVSNSTRVTVSNRSLTLGANQTIGLAIFGGITGSAVDASSFNVTLDEYGRTAAYGTVTASFPSGTQGVVTCGAMGAYTLLLPPGPPPSLLVSGGAFVSQAPWFPLPNVLAGQVTIIGEVGLPHYGFVNLTAVGSSGSPVGEATVTVTTPDPTNLSSWVVLGTTTPSGGINLSAAPGAQVTVNVSAPGLFASERNVTVVSSQATVLGSVTLSVPVSAPVSWVRSRNLSDPGGAGSGGIVDGNTGQAVPGAVITAYNPAGGASPAGSASNRLGEFLTHAPPGAPDTLLVGRVGFVTNSTPVVVTSGNASVVSPVNLTADGVISGLVRAQPSGARVDGAFVVACPISLEICGNVEYTNHTGSFWTAVAPGWARITVGAPGYSNNTTFALVCSDCFVELGAIGLPEYGAVVGIVQGTPGDTPLSAQVSLCPANATGSPCPFQVPTPPTGTFAVSAPAGTLELSVTSPGYDMTRLLVGLSPGEVLNVGNLTLQANGTVVGRLADASTGSPIVGAPVALCQVALCAPAVLSAPDGSFLLRSGPGDWVLTISATGYLPAELNVTVTSAGSQDVGTIELVAASPNGTYAVSGEVQTADGAPFAGATVSVRVGSVVAAATVSGADGSFAVWVARGSYSISPSAPGWIAAGLGLVVTAPVLGLVLTLSPYGYDVRGTVTDGLTGAPLSGARVAEEALLLGTTDPAGGYRVSLGNGTHDLTFSAPAASAVGYPTVQVSLTVQAAPVYRSVSLLPPMVRLTVSIVDRASGLAIPGATTELSGSAVDDAAIDQRAPSSPAGTAVLDVPVGAYVLTAAAPGHTGASRLLALNASRASLSELFELNSTSPAPAHGSPLGSLGPAVPIALGALVATLAALFWWRRRRVPWTDDRPVARPDDPPAGEAQELEPTAEPWAPSEEPAETAATESG